MSDRKRILEPIGIIHIPDSMFKETLKNTINAVLEKAGWISVGEDNENIPFDDPDALFEVYSPACDLSDYGSVSCYRVSVMTTNGRGGVTHFRPIKANENGKKG